MQYQGNTHGSLHQAREWIKAAARVRVSKWTAAIKPSGQEIQRLEILRVGHMALTNTLTLACFEVRVELPSGLCEDFASVV